MSANSSVGHVSSVAPSHTPGPWRAIVTGPHDVHGASILSVVGKRSQVGYEGSVVCRVAPPEHHTAEDDANARLIAAAPELLEALKLAYPSFKRTAMQFHHSMSHGHDCFENCAHCDCIAHAKQLDTLRAAISKAERGQ